MTVPSDNIKIEYAGTGSAGPFVTPQFLVNDDITAVLRDASDVETTLVLGTDYNLVAPGPGNSPQGTLTTTGPLSPPVAGQTLVIKTDPDVLQETDFVEGGNFTSDALESSLDRLTLINQSQDELFARTIRFPLSDTAASSQLPIDTERAGKVMTFDGTGQPTVSNAIDLFTTTIFVTNADSPYTVGDAAAGALIRVDTTAGPVELRFADTAGLTSQEGDFGKISIANQDNIVTLTAVTPGELRSQNGTAEWTATTDPVYGGTSDISNGGAADEAEIRIKRLGGLWILNGELREASVENREIVTRKSLVLQESEAGAHTFVQADQGKEKLFTGGSVQNWTVPALAAGTAVVVHNIGTATITFLASGVTLKGSVNLAADKSASLSWLTAGTIVKLTGELS